MASYLCPYHAVSEVNLIFAPKFLDLTGHRRAVKTKTVLSTWGGTIRDEDLLPENWINEAGVLVGIGDQGG